MSTKSKSIIMKKLIILLLLVSEFTFAQNLWQPYYITPRTNKQHIDLSQNWQLNYTSQPVTELGELPAEGWFTVAYPTSVHWALFKAGELPDPYVGLNSQKYEWVETAVWYYKNSFEVTSDAKDKYIFLNFDGIDYFARIWLNGNYLGEHEGMFGGPALEISDLVKFGEKNEIIVEVRSANYDDPQSYNPRDPGKIIKPWEFTGGSAAEPWFTVGMWKGARIEIVPRVHLERPFLITKSIDEGVAELQLQAQIYVNDHSLNYEMHPWQVNVSGTYYYDKSNYIPYKEQLKLKIFFNKDGKTKFIEEFNVDVFEKRNWINKTFVLDNPDLWWPNGLGEPNLYQVSIQLWQSNQKIDEIEFDYGIRIIENVSTPGPQYCDVWYNWQFVINGKKMFVKGMNWMPVDVLLDLTKEKYNWVVNLAKEGGIQMFRVWGAGLLETEEFYNACNRMGIMVWQDFPIANYGTARWPQDVWEAQVTLNIFRLRNHPSLVMYNGGNEFNPYGFDNSTSIGVLERSLKIFDPTRLFTRASPDGGSIHTYPDMDPVWYSKTYKWVPYIAETGIHSITDPQGLYEIIDPNEFQNLGNMYSKEFVREHPQFIHHFAEFSPSRVPRMLSRASHIDNMRNPTLESIAEATQIGAGEFYQIMSEKVQSNYPVTAGLMPWVFKRPWPVVSAIHFVDGFGQPSAPYYFLKRTYEPVHVMLNLERSFWAPGDEMKLITKVINHDIEFNQTATLHLTIYSDKFEKLFRKSSSPEIKGCPSVNTVDLGYYIIPQDYVDRYLIIEVELLNKNGNLISRSIYWPRSLTEMTSMKFREDYLTKPMEWPTLKDGPWLKPIINNSLTRLKTKLISQRKTKEGNEEVIFEIKNTGNLPSFMTQIDVTGGRRIFYANENFFWLKPGESKNLTVVIQWLDDKQSSKYIVVKSWNSEINKIKL